MRILNRWIAQERVLKLISSFAIVQDMPDVVLGSFHPEDFKPMKRTVEIEFKDLPGFSMKFDYEQFKGGYLSHEAMIRRAAWVVADHIERLK